MNPDCWVLITAEPWRGALAAARSLGGRTTAVVIGPRALADEVAKGGADDVRWITPPEATPPEAYAISLGAEIAAAAPLVILSTSDPAGRVLLGASAAQRKARLVADVIGLRVEEGQIRVLRSAVGGETVETLVPEGPVAAIYVGDDAEPSPSGPAPVSAVELAPAPLALVAHETRGAASGLDDASRVVSLGRGLKAKDDLSLVRSLAGALDAEIACSMPIADDLGWLDKTRYVGRSGSHIAPDLYLAIGIAGAPQHMEGVRGAKVVAAVNNDPEARIFRTADYGIVGDLYDVVPALIAELAK